MQYLFPHLRMLNLVALVMLASNVMAEEEEAQAVESTSYVTMSPSFISNVTSASGRLHYIKADVALKVRGDATVDAVTYHDHLLKHKLLMVISGQEFSTLATGEGQAALRSEVLDELVSVLEEEEAASDIIEVLFTNFLIE